ncbi:MAG: hypothetical protein EOO38_21035 [Cytophagaceae bacterium]|nr:MAG: hypothetical protein EOO38_21035 [Cytophagaceae bacterium]
MTQSDHPLFDVDIADPAVEAVLTMLTASAELAIRVRAETEALEGETRQIVKANLALMMAPLLSQDTVQAAIASARRWRL